VIGVALVLALQTPMSSKGDAARGPVAVVIADFSKGHWLDTPPCPDDYICLDGLLGSDFHVRRTLAGENPPTAFHSEVWLHVRPKKRRLAFLIEHIGAQWKILGKSNSAYACFDRATLEAVGLGQQGWAYEEDSRCFIDPSTFPTK
jgi:hypothetical protein